MGAGRGSAMWVWVAVPSCGHEMGAGARFQRAGRVMGTGHSFEVDGWEQRDGTCGMRWRHEDAGVASEHCHRAIALPRLSHSTLTKGCNEGIAACTTMHATASNFCLFGYLDSADNDL